MAHYLMYRLIPKSLHCIDNQCSVNKTNKILNVPTFNILILQP